MKVWLWKLNETKLKLPTALVEVRDEIADYIGDDLKFSEYPDNKWILPKGWPSAAKPWSK